MKGFLQWFVTLVLALVVIIGANSIPALKRIDALTDQHRRPLIAITLSITIAGWLIFMGSLVMTILLAMYMPLFTMIGNMGQSQGVPH